MTKPKQPLFAKPRVRQTGPTCWLVTVGSRTAVFGQTTTGEWYYAASPLSCGTVAHDCLEALTQAIFLATPEPPAVIGHDLEESIEQACHERNDTNKLLRRILKLRTGLTWSVSGGRGTAFGWISIEVPRARRVDSKGALTQDPHGYLAPADRALIARVLGRSRPVHFQGFGVRAGTSERRRLLRAAAGLEGGAA